MRTILNGMPRGGNKGGTADILSGDQYRNGLARATPLKLSRQVAATSCS